MRHKRRGRHLGRTSSHRKALLRNLACSLFLTERDPDYYEGMTQADGKSPVNPPKFPGRIVTTLHKAKEVRPLVEKCITIAKKALPTEAAAEQFAPSAERNTDGWRKWKESDEGRKWREARAPMINARRKVFSILRDKEAVEILFEDIAPRFTDRNGGYTRIMKMAMPRLGDAGVQAILEFVGKNDKVKQKSAKPSFEDDAPKAKQEEPKKEEPKEEEVKDDAAGAVAAAGAGAAAAGAATDEEALADLKSPKGIKFDDLKVVEGIGPKCEEALKAAGIGTWKDLADSTPEKIKEILTEADGNFAGQVPTTWPEQAGMAVAEEWEKLEKWQDELDGGKLPE